MRNIDGNSQGGTGGKFSKLENQKKPTKNKEMI